MEIINEPIFSSIHAIAKCKGENLSTMKKTLRFTKYWPKNIIIYKKIFYLFS
jgi:hypothetical protein